MLHVGEIARELREALGLTQHEMAASLGVTNVHISNVENNKSFPSQQLMDRYRTAFDIDLYIVAWCRHGDVDKLPPSLRKPAHELGIALQLRIDQLVQKSRESRQ